MVKKIIIITQITMNNYNDSNDGVDNNYRKKNESFLLKRTTLLGIRVFFNK